MSAWRIAASRVIFGPWKRADLYENEDWKESCAIPMTFGYSEKRVSVRPI